MLQKAAHGRNASNDMRAPALRFMAKGAKLY